MKLKNMKIKTKLILGFGVIIVMILSIMVDRF